MRPGASAAFSLRDATCARGSAICAPIANRSRCTSSRSCDSSGVGMGARGANPGVQLVHVAEGRDAGVVLADARAVDEARLAAVSGLRIDLHDSLSGSRATVAGAEATSTTVPGSAALRWT